MYTKAVIPYKPSSSANLFVYMKQKVSYVHQGSTTNTNITTNLQMFSKAVNMIDSYLISSSSIIVILVISVEISTILVLWINTRTILATLVNLCRCNLALNTAFLALTRC